MGIKTSAKSIDFVKKTSNVREIDRFCGEKSKSEGNRVDTPPVLTIFWKNKGGGGI